MIKAPFPLQAPKGFLLLEDGTFFAGRLIGPTEPTVAEVVFNTNMTGYQEVFTDPSYRGQIVVMTAPQIGNYGVNDQDPESDGPQVAGVVVREISRSWSNWRGNEGLPEWLTRHNVPALVDLDTRRLTLHLRSRGVMRGVIGVGETPSKEALKALDACPAMVGLDLASVVTTEEPYQWGKAQAGYHIVAYDYGIKRSILRLFEEEGCRVTVVPAETPVSDVLAMHPDGVFLSNGPGDPSAVAYAPDTVLQLAESGVPLFGICLGHQFIGLAYGGRTEKMPFGHRGGNHPVKDMETGEVLITSQNHGFTLAGSASGVDGAPELIVTHINLNDDTIEGVRHRERPIFAVQYHPEAAPGPRDAVPLFGRFLAAVREHRVRSASTA